MKTWAMWGAVLLLGIGCALRVAGLAALPLWVDEGFTAYLTQQPDVLAVLRSDVHPPLYFLAVTAWTRVAGISEFSLRFFSVLGGMVSMALVYALARAVAPRRERTTYALLALCLLAFADMELYIAQEARAYSWHVALAAAAVWAFVRWGQAGKARHLCGVTVFNALLVYTHYLGAWVGVTQGLYALLAWRGRKRALAVGALVVSALAVAVWAAAVVLPYQLQTIGGHTRTDLSTLETLRSYAGAFLGGQWVLGVGIVAVGVLGSRWRVRWLLLLWLVLPVALTFAVNAFAPRLLFDYRLSQLTPAAALLLALGLLQFAPHTRAFLLAVLLVYGLLHVDVGRFKEDWRGMGQQIAANTEAGDGVVVDFGGGDFQLTYYLDRFLPAGVDSFSMRQQKQSTPASYEADALAFLSKHDGIWLVRWHDSDEAFAKLGLAGHTRTAVYPLATENNMDIWLYRYDHLPETALGTFDNGMRLLAAQVGRQHVRLWWTVDAPVSDVTVSVKALGAAGTVLAQHDRPPQPPSSTWQANAVYYDALPLVPPSETAQVVVELYVWAGDAIVTIPYEKTNKWAVIGQLAQ